MMKLTEKEQAIRNSLKGRRPYPQWKYDSTTMGFLYYIHPHRWIQEVNKTLDNRWWVEEGALHFNRLEDALFYAERLVNASVEIKKPGRGVCQPRHAPIATRDAAVEEKLRREAIMLKP